MTKIQFATLCAGFFALVLLSGCSSNKGTTTENETTPKTDSAAMVADAPQRSGVTFEDGNGQLIALDDLIGNVVFINFWATWCPPCIHEMPSIQALKNEFDDHKDLIFLMVDVDGKHKQAQAFMDKRNFDLPVYIPHSDIPGQLLGSAIPTTIIFDKSGAIAARIEGSRDYTDPAIINGIKHLIEE